MLLVQSHSALSEEDIEKLKNMLAELSQGSELVKLGSSLARHQGQEEQEVVRHLFQRLSLVLMRGNAQLLVNRMPPDVPDGEVDGTL